mgnify:CR=1 FL=1
MLPVYDWKTTRAFSLPTDQYGWIRLNLAGREAQGIVSVDQYDETCEQLEAMLLALTTESGASLVRDIVRTAASAKCALGNPLPDLVVHWEDAAFASPLRIKDSKVRAKPVGKNLRVSMRRKAFAFTVAVMASTRVARSRPKT